MADPTALNVLDDARVLLNDAAGNQWNDGVLLPCLKIAWDELAVILADNDIAVIREISDEVTVDSNTTEILGPTDLITPIRLDEKGVGEDDTFFTPIVQRRWEPDYNPNDFLNYYAWRKQKFVFPAHNTSRVVRIKYLKDLSAIADVNSQLAVHHCKVVLAKRTAAIAARYIGANPTRADALDSEAKVFVDMVISREVKTNQNFGVRRRGYRSNRFSTRFRTGY